MVIKENMPEREMETGEEWDERTPREVTVMERMNKTNCPSIVELFTYRRFRQTRTHRLYL